MRGGEPMALGVNEVFPTVSFVHDKDPEDLQIPFVQDRSTIILVDSVINTGKTIVDFGKRVRDLDNSPTGIRVVVVTGIMQGRSARNSGELARQLDGLGKVTVISLRLSENKYTGSGGTDTGNRLFNTTHVG